MTTKGETMTNEQHEAVTVEAMHAGTLPSWLTPAAATPSPAVTEVTRPKAVVAALVDEHNAANARAEEAEAISYDIAASAALETQNLREELTAMRQRAEAAEAALAIADQRGWHKEAQETLAVNMQLGLQIDQLRAELAATTARAEAEAQLATDRGKAIAAATARAEAAEAQLAVLLGCYVWPEAQP